MADILFPHIKFLERGWNEYDETKDSVCYKMMNKTRIYVPSCIEKVDIGRTPLQEWCILNIEM